jgi:release factor glutamine methyltransferase
MTRTLEEALKRASFCLREAGIDNPRTEAELLLSWILGLDRLSLLVKQQELITDSDYKIFEDAWHRRANHEPLAYITGEKYFYGRSYLIGPGVLIPRPESELLIELAVEWVKNNEVFKQNGLRILDLGTGSGALAITLALELPFAEVWAVDIVPEALSLAGRNAALHHLKKRIKFLKGNYFDALDRIHPAPQFNLIVSNPPYINAAELPGLSASVVQFEPSVALDGGEDGLDSYREILKKVALYADLPALLLVEIGSTQAQAVTGLFKKSGLFRMIGCRRDLAYHPRVIIGLL